MLLRRVIKHFKNQEWTAVFLDFLIVVIGVFVGLQVSNWNAAQAERVAEHATLERLENEFLFQEAELKALIDRLTLYKASAKLVTMSLKSGAPPENTEQFLKALTGTPNLGRPPARSAIYVQLLSSGDLDLLSNGDLRDLLVRYDQNIERNSFMFGQTLGLLLNTGDYYAATNSNFSEAGNIPDDRSEITEFDFEALKSSEGKVEWLYYMHSNNLLAVIRQLELAKEILFELKKR